MCLFKLSTRIVSTMKRKPHNSKQFAVTCIKIPKKISLRHI